MVPSRALSFPSLAVAALVAFAGVARADDPPMNPPVNPPAAPGTGEAPRNSRFFDTYDANQDGKVTKDEYTGDPAVFDVVDADKDGVVTLAELGMPADYKPRPLPKPMDERSDAGRSGNLAERLEKFKLQLAGWDADKDGKVTKEEYKGKLPFETMDRNKDGVISMEDLRGAGKGEPGKPGTPGTPGTPGGMPNPDEMRQRFKDADKNGDGKVTKDEFPGPPERFAMLDRNQDGAVTADEIEASLKDGMNGEGGRGKRMFQRFDKDGDGKVSRTEFPGGDEAFKAMDKNGDGFVTAEEVPAGRPGKGDKPPEPTGAPAPTTPGETPMNPTPPAAGAPSGGLGTLFNALDRDHDGKLSRAEFPGTDDEWRRLDRNANGWIEADEAK